MKTPAAETAAAEATDVNGSQSVQDGAGSKQISYASPGVFVVRPSWNRPARRLNAGGQRPISLMDFLGNSAVRRLDDESVTSHNCRPADRRRHRA
jgi:hypothetical protein